MPAVPSLHHQELPQQRDLRREPTERAAGAQLPREVKRSVQIQTGCLSPLVFSLIFPIGFVFLSN